MNIITADQLNQIGAMLGTNDKNVIFTAVLAGLVKQGVDLADAFDALFGAGAYAKFAGSVYTALCAR